MYNRIQYMSYYRGDGKKKKRKKDSFSHKNVSRFEPDAKADGGVKKRERDDRGIRFDGREKIG